MLFLGGLYSVPRAHQKKTIKRDAINVESPASYAKELNYITSFTLRSARGLEVDKYKIELHRRKRGRVIAMWR